MIPWRINFISEFRLSFEGSEQPVRSRRAQALLAYLSLTDKGWLSRDRLADLLWSDREDAQAKQSLRQVLTSLRKVFGEGPDVPLLTSRDAVFLNPDRIQNDVQELQDLIGESAFAQAVELCRGEFLEGLHIRSEPFEDWLSIQRERISGLSCVALEGFALKLAEETPFGAVETAKRLVEVDPLREASHQTLIRLMVEAGDRDGALAQYRSLKRVLQRELQIEPSSESRALYDSIVGKYVDGKPLENSRSKDGLAGSDKSLFPANLSSPSSEKPSIAVLPFENAAGDRSADYFCDGIAEDVLTGLSRISWLFVVARNSSFVYRDRQSDAGVIGNELQVKYVLEGSVRLSGGRVRVTANLIETGTGQQKWADRYEGDLENIFLLQDEIAAGIVSTLVPELTAAEISRVARERPENLRAWDLYLQALPHLNALTAKDHERAIELLKKAIGIEPEFVEPHAAMARSWTLAGILGWTKLGAKSFDVAKEAADAALRLGAGTPSANCAYALVLSVTGETMRAAGFAERAIELDPNLNEAHGVLAWAFALQGKPGEALKAASRALRGSPRDPLRWMWFHAVANAHFAANDLERAITAAERTVVERPSWAGSYIILAASAAHLGRTEFARHSITRLRQSVPRFSIKGVTKNPMWVRGEDIDRLISGLRLAGLPEH